MSNYVKIKIGDKFGRLTIVEDLGYFKKGGTKTKRHWYKCLCDCGNECIVEHGNLKSNHVKSCGCLKNNIVKRKSNVYYVLNNITYVKFSDKNEYFIIDTEDIDMVNKYYWYKNDSGYIISGNQKVRLARLIMSCPKDKIVDHINGNPLDNRKYNLRVATKRENAFNKSMRNDNTSGYIGVHYSSQRNKWIAQIQIDGKNKYLGIFESIEDAIKARQDAEIKYFGEFRRCA